MVQKCLRIPSCGGRHTAFQPCVGTKQLESDAPAPPKPKPTQARLKAPKPPKVTMAAIRAESAKTLAQGKFDPVAYHRQYMKDYMRKRRAKGAAQ